MGCPGNSEGGVVIRRGNESHAISHPTTLWNRISNWHNECQPLFEAIVITQSLQIREVKLSELQQRTRWKPCLQCVTLRYVSEVRWTVSRKWALVGRSRSSGRGVFKSAA